MPPTWKELLDEFNKVRLFEYRTDPDREYAMRIEMEHMILMMLERLYIENYNAPRS